MRRGAAPPHGSSGEDTTAVGPDSMVGDRRQLYATTPCSLRVSSVYRSGCRHKEPTWISLEHDRTLDTSAATPWFCFN
jgi:hypothetical protein